jgi:hypothetical protein
VVERHETIAVFVVPVCNIVITSALHGSEIVFAYEVEDPTYALLNVIGV